MALAPGPPEAVKDRVSSREALIEAKKQQEPNLETIKKRAEKVPESGDKDADMIAALKAEITPDKQQGGLWALQSRLMTLVVSLKEVGADVTVLKKSPEKLYELVQKHQEALKIKLGEEGLAKMNGANMKFQMLLKEDGPTSAHLKSSEFWLKTIGESLSIWEDPLAKYKEFYESNKPLAVIATGAAVLGIALSIKWLLSSKKEGTAGTAEKKSWLKPLVIGATVVGLPVALYLGKDKIMEWMAKSALEKLPSKEAQEAYKKAKEGGTALPGEYRKELEEMGDSGKKWLEEIDKNTPPNASTVSNEPQIKATEIEVEDENGKIEKATPEMIEKEIKEGSFDAATNAFLMLYFHEKRTFSGDQKLIFKQTINDLASTKFSEIKGKYEAGKKTQKINKTDFPQIVTDISEEDLFLLFEGMVKISSFSGAKNKSNVEVKELFERVWNNPLFEQFKGLTGRVKGALENGDVGDAIESMATDGGEFAQEKFTEILEQLDQKLDMKVEGLNENDLKIYREIQLQFLNTSQVNQKPEAALANILKTHEKYKEHPLSIALAEEFFVKVNTKTPDVLKKIYTNFQIQHKNGTNHLTTGLTFEKLGFAHACELIGLESAMEESDDSGASLLLISAILRSFNDETEKNKYIGDLVSELSNEAPKIKIPGIEKLRPTFDKMGNLAVRTWWHSFLKTMEIGKGFSTNHPTARPSEEFATAAINNTFVSFLHEGGGAGLEMAEDALAGLILALPTSAAENYLGSCENAQDFLKLIRVNGGNVALTEGRDGAPLFLIEVAGEIFVARPSKILVESFKAFPNVMDASRIVAVGSAPFMIWGGIAGFIKGNKVPGGRTQYTLGSSVKNMMFGVAKGMTYPIKAPIMAYKGMKRSVQTIATGPQGIKAVGEETIAKGRRVLNWGKDIMRYKNFGQSVENIAITERILDRHFAEVIKGESTSPGINRRDGNFKRSWKKFKANSIDFYKDTVQLVTDPKESLKQFISYDFHLRLAQRNATRLGEQLNAFYHFDDKSGFSLMNMDHNEIKEIRDSARRLRNFGDYISKNPRLVEELKLFIEIADKDKLYDEVLKILNQTGLNDKESRALARRVQEAPEELDQILDQVKRGVAKYEELGGAKSGKKAKLDSEIDSNNLKTSENPAESLKNAEKQLTETEKKVAAAKKEIQDALDAHAQGKMKADALQPKVDQAREVIAKGEIARAKLEKMTASLKEVERLEAELSKASNLAAGEAGRLAAELSEQAKIAREAGELASEAVEVIKTPGKWATGTKLGAKFLGGVMGGFGVGFSAVNTIGSGYEAFTTNVEGRAAVKGAESALWAVNTGLDAAAVAVMFGAEGTAVSIGSAAALPALPVLYASDAILETLNQDTKTDYEWIQSNPYEVMHHFYTTAHSFSFGESMIVGGKALVGTMSPFGPTLKGGLNERENVKKETMHRIYRGMMAMQKNPHLINIIFNGQPPSEEKNKEIESQIKANYTPNHEFYFQHSLNAMGRYNEVQKVVLEAQMFDDIMSKRDLYKGKGAPFKLSNLQLDSDDYDIPNGKAWSLEKPPYFTPFQVVEAYKTEAGKILETGDPIVTKNLERMDSAYLVKMHVQIGSVLAENKGEITKEEGLLLEAQALLLKNYLEIKRGINFEMAIRNPEFRFPKMSLLTLKEHLEGMGKVENKAYLEYERINYDLTPGVHSLYKLAEYFGYIGKPSEADLKKFFNQGSASFHGLYWNGDNWVLGERGWEVDDLMGKNITTDTIKKVIKRMREQPDNILEHRNDAVVADAYNYTAEVGEMATLLEKGLKEGLDRNYIEA